MSVLKIKNENGEWVEITTIQGPAGHTPVKGVDYFTEAEVNEFKQTIANLPPASTSVLGGVKIDGTTILINDDGVISSVVPTDNRVFIEYGDTSEETAVKLLKLAEHPATAACISPQFQVSGGFPQREILQLVEIIYASSQNTNDYHFSCVNKTYSYSAICKCKTLTDGTHEITWSTNATVYRTKLLNTTDVFNNLIDPAVESNTNSIPSVSGVKNYVGSYFTAGDGIQIVDGTISLSLSNAEEGSF